MHIFLIHDFPFTNFSRLRTSWLLLINSRLLTWKLPKNFRILNCEVIFISELCLDSNYDFIKFWLQLWMITMIYLINEIKFRSFRWKNQIEREEIWKMFRYQMLLLKCIYQLISVAFSWLQSSPLLPLNLHSFSCRQLMVSSYYWINKFPITNELASINYAIR